MFSVRLLALLTVGFCVHAAPGDIYLSNGGYRGILLAIDENVPYDANILPNLRKIFVEASEALYRATEYDIRNSGKPEEGLTSAKHFAQIKVLVPKSWPRQDCSGSVSELYGDADFRVIRESRQWGQLLFTQMVASECREPGEYTLVPETFAKDLGMAREIYGQDLGKAIVHEWAQLRWGLREESNRKEGGESCTVLEDWNLYRYRKPTRCSQAVGGLRTEDPEDDTKCIFYPEMDTSASASLMFFRLPFYENMYTFCDSMYLSESGQVHSPAFEVLHDPEAETPHNHVCGRQSAWQVLRDHPDFDPDNAAPIDLEFDFDANLNFQCVQRPQSSRMVLVMDTSSSMSGSRLRQMQGDVALFLQSLPFEEYEIGMVEFDGNSNILQYMTHLNSVGNLWTLLNAIPSGTGSGTCIGCGIRSALQILQASGSAAGANIIVFTDGGENSKPYIKDVTNEVLVAEAIVHGVLITGVADSHDLIKLAGQSGGDFCIYEDSGSGGIDYYQCLMDIVINSGTFTAMEVMTDDLSVPKSDAITRTVPIDSSFKDSLRFVFSWTSDTFLLTNNRQGVEAPERELRQNGCGLFEMQLTAPDGTVIQTGDARYSKQDEFRLIMIDASGFEAGEWQYSVQNPHTKACDGRLRIEGFPDRSSADDADHPILMTAYSNKVSVDVDKNGNPMDNIVTLYATLSQGLSPVLDAEVYANVEKGSYSQRVSLVDNGLGADSKKDDGVYSAYFYQYQSKGGAHSVRAYAQGIPGNTSILRESRALQSTQDGYDVVRAQSRLPVAAFERAAIGGAFEVATNGVSDMNSIIPPARINDFRRGEMGSDRVELLWTAVGASMMDGTASRYEVRVQCGLSGQLDPECGGDEVTVEDDMLIDSTLTAPGAPGASERIVISLEHLATPPPDTSYYAVIQAVDAYGNLGAASNLAVVQGPVSSEKNSAAIIAGSLACVAVLGTALVGGALVYRNKKNMQLHPTV